MLKMDGTHVCANRVDPDQMPHDAASDLHSLPNSPVVLGTSTGSKIDFFKFQDKYGIELWSTSRKHTYITLTPLNPTFI